MSFSPKLKSMLIAVLIIMAGGGIAPFAVCAEVAGSAVPISGVLPMPSPEQMATFILKGGKVEITSSYTPKEGEENVDAMMTPSPADRIKDRLAGKFFVTGTGTDTLKFTITNASIVQEYKEEKSWFMTKGEYKYKAMFAVEVAMLDKAGKTLARAFCKAWGTRTISGTTSIEDREKSLAEMTDKLVDNLLGQIGNEMDKSFKAFLVQK